MGYRDMTEEECRINLANDKLKEAGVTRRVYDLIDGEWVNSVTGIKKADELIKRGFKSMSFDPEKVKEYCINKLKKGNEEPSEGRMRANMANKHIGSSADEVLQLSAYAQAELRVLAASISPQELFDMPDSDEMAEVYPKNNEYHSEGGTELQFTIHHERFLNINDMTIDLGIIPAIGHEDGQLDILLTANSTWYSHPCSESNYEALQAIWMKVRLTGL